MYYEIVYDMLVNVNVIYYVHVCDMLVNVNVIYYVHVYDMLVNVNVIYYVHVCEQARWARSAGNSAIENLCIIIIIYLGRISATRSTKTARRLRCLSIVLRVWRHSPPPPPPTHTHLPTHPALPLPRQVVATRQVRHNSQDGAVH